MELNTRSKGYPSTGIQGTSGGVVGAPAAWDFGLGVAGMLAGLGH